MPPLLLFPLYLAVVLAPLALSALAGYPRRPVADELAAGTGMLAFAIVLVEFVLSGRFRAISGKIGMDVTMRTHQVVARTGLALALVHPFLYSLPMNPARPWDVTRATTITADPAALGSGIAAWVLLFALVLTAIGRDHLGWRYETWRAVHAIGAVAIAALLLHHTLAAGRYGADPRVAGYWTGLFVLAVLSLAWARGVAPFGRRRWQVARVEKLAERTWEVALAPESHKGLAYRAGQFVWLNIGHARHALAENPFSLASAPAAGPELRFVIKELGDFTNRIGAVEPGTPAFVDGPHGTLTIDGRVEPGVVMIAGGVGIAPMLGLLRQMQATGDARQRLLIYANRAESQIVHRDELDALAEDPRCDVVHVLSEPSEGWEGPTGFVDAALLARLLPIPQARGWLHVLCGPPEMLAAVEDALIGLGVPARQILSERFRYD